MTADDVKPGMFVTVSVPTQNIVIFIVGDEPETETFRTVDITRMVPSFLSYYAVTEDMKEFNGNIDTAKKKVIKASFNKRVGK